MASPAWISIEDALERMLAQAPLPGNTVLCNTASALGKVASEDVIASHSVPPLAVSAMDGFALCLKDTVSKTPLRIVHTVLAGQDVTQLRIGPGEAARIMTGAGLPAGADAVVMQENTDYDASSVTVNIPPQPYENIRPEGNDIGCGDVIIAKGTRLRARHLMLLASVGLTQCRVYRPIRIGLLATGDEIKAPGTSLLPGQIYNANSVGIAALLSAFDAQITDLGISDDDPKTLQTLLEQAAREYDLIISSGGVSVGDADHVKPVLDKLGQVNFWKVAIKPGKPFAFGAIGKCLFCGLPGNPVSAYVTTEQLVLPLVEKMQGLKPGLNPLRGQAVLTRDIKRQPGRQEYLRATLAVQPDGTWQVTPLTKQSSGVMTSVTKANAYIIVPAQTQQLHAGETVQVAPFTN